MNSMKKLMVLRERIQWSLAGGFILLNIILFFFWKQIAYLPLILLPFMLLSVFFYSRGFCGWACPRAAFLERIMKYFSLKKPIPKFMQSWWVSIGVMTILLSRVIYVGFNQGLLAAGALLCIVPTIGALLVGWYNPKMWCTICPTGTMMKILDRTRRVFKVKKEDCLDCKICDKSCPMGITVSKAPEYSLIEEKNCTQCGLCVASCPTNKLDLVKTADLKLPIKTNEQLEKTGS